MDTAHDGITELEDGIEKLSQDPGGEKERPGRMKKSGENGRWIQTFQYFS